AVVRRLDRVDPHLAAMRELARAFRRDPAEDTVGRRQLVARAGRAHALGERIQRRAAVRGSPEAGRNEVIDLAVAQLRPAQQRLPVEVLSVGFFGGGGLVVLLRARLRARGAVSVDRRAPLALEQLGALAADGFLAQRPLFGRDEDGPVALAGVLRPAGD